MAPLSLGLGLDPGSSRAGPNWAAPAALLDVDFAAARFFFKDRHFASEAAWLSAIGGTKSGSKRTIGPYDIPGAPEAVTNGSFSGGTQVDLVPVNPTGSVLAGSRVVNADGSLTLGPGTNLRFYYPYASLTNGRVYQFSVEVLALSGGVASMDLTDIAVLPRSIISEVGVFKAYQGRATYDASNCWLDIETFAGVTLTLKAAPALHAEDGSVAGWTATTQGGSPSMPLVSASGFGAGKLVGNGANIPAMAQAIPVLKGHAYRLRQRRQSTDPTMIRPTLLVPGGGGANIYLATGGITYAEQTGCFSAPIDNAYLQLAIMENASGSTSYSDDLSVKEVLPCAGFAQGGLSGIIKGTTPATASGSKIIFQADSGSTTYPHPTPNEVDYVRLVWDASKHLRLIVVFTSNSTVEQANLDLGVVDVSTPFEVCFSVADNAFRAALRGGPIIADTSGNMPGLAVLRIGCGATTSNDWDGAISRVALFPFARSEPGFAAFSADASSIVAWGDSLTASAGASSEATRYPAVAAAAFDPDRSIVNLGIGGQTSTQIAARMGAIPITVTLSGDHIPASGAIAVTAKNVNILYNSGSYTGTQAGWIGGIYGIMSTDLSGNWTFTRAVTGADTPVPAGSLFTPDWGGAVRSRTSWLWLGRNGAQSGYTITGDVAAAVASLGHSRYLVGGVITGSIDGGSGLASFLATNAALSATYGPRYVDLLGALQAANDGSANDLSDIAAGWVPRSLRSDPVHLNDAGYAVVAAQFKAKTLAMGW